MSWAKSAGGEKMVESGGRYRVGTRHEGMGLVSGRHKWQEYDRKLEKRAVGKMRREDRTRGWNGANSREMVGGCNTSGGKLGRKRLNSWQI